MNFYSKKIYFSLLIPTAFFAGSFQPVFAASLFSGESNIILTIDSIVSSSGNTAGLSIDGLFEIGTATTAPGFGNAVTGDGQSSYTYTGANQLPLAVSAGNSVNQFFNATGGAGNGSIDSYYQAYGTFNFANNSASDIFTINFSLLYTLIANTSGEFAESQVSIDYYDDLFLVTAGSDMVIANTLTIPNAAAFNSSPLTFSMTLNAGDFNTFYTDVAITGTASSVSAVPLPAAFWLFLSGVIGLRRYQGKAMFARN